MEEGSFLRAFETKRYIKKYLKMPCERDGLSEKESVTGFISWTQRTLIFYVWGPSGNLVMGQGCPELISDYGARKVCL